MKDFRITAEIRLFCDHIEFKEPFDVTSDSNMIKKMEFKSQPEKIVVDYLVTAESEKEAQELADFHLNFLTDRLAFRENIPVEETKIVSIVCTEQEGQNLSVRVSEFINLQDSVVVKKIIGKESIEKIKEFLESDISSDAQELLTMYREAISERSIGSRLYQLYKILIKIIGDDRKRIDEYIKNAYPQIEIRKSGKRNNEDVTIFTWIRDDIHVKQAKFPYKEISDNISKLQDLVRKAIESKL